MPQKLQDWTWSSHTCWNDSLKKQSKGMLILWSGVSTSKWIERTFFRKTFSNISDFFWMCHLLATVSKSSSMDSTHRKCAFRTGLENMFMVSQKVWTPTSNVEAYNVSTLETNHGLSKFRWSSERNFRGRTGTTKKPNKLLFVCYCFYVFLFAPLICV